MYFREETKLGSSEDNTVIEMLQKTPLWSGLGKQELKSIVNNSKERKFESGDIIASKGEGGVGFYLILDGAVEIRSDGKTLSKLGSGQFFGEMSVIDNQPRSADVVALEPSRVLILTAWKFKALITDNPKMAIRMLQELVRRLRSLDRTLTE